MTKTFSAKTLMRAAVYEGVRCWLAFDGVLVNQIKDQSGHITIAQIRAIASHYYFRRNLPTEYDRVKFVACAVNKFSEKVYSSFYSRAADIETSIENLHVELRESSKNTRAVRPVSGMTKLIWFVAPKNWTPFDRLAADALGIKKIDSIERMLCYYKKLDKIGFAEKSAQITFHAQNTPFAAVSGERILDKFLMLNGDKKWTADKAPIALDFLKALPTALQSDIEKFADTIISDNKCLIDLEETK